MLVVVEPEVNRSEETTWVRRRKGGKERERERERKRERKITSIQSVQSCSVWLTFPSSG